MPVLDFPSTPGLSAVMTLSFESWIALVAALALLAATPGPGWAAVISTALARGFAPAVAMAVGMSLGDVVFLLLAIFGLSVLAELMGSLFLIVKIAGGAYLIYLGVRMWMKAPTAPATAAVQGGYSGVFLAGFGITLGNPKVIGFYLGFFPAFMDVSALTRYDIVAVAVTTPAVEMVCC